MISLRKLLKNKKLFNKFIVLFIVIAIGIFIFKLNTTSISTMINDNVNNNIDSVYRKNNQCKEKLTDYSMKLNFNTDSKTLAGTEIVTFTNEYGVPLNELVFHLYADSYNENFSSSPIVNNFSTNATASKDFSGDIYISKVICDGANVSFSQENQILKVFLQKPLKNLKTITISIDFQVKIPTGTNRFGYIDNQFSFTNWYPILSMYNPNSNTWNEVLFNPIGESNFSNCSNYTVKITLPKDFFIVSTGTTTQSKKHKDHKEITMEALKVRDFAMFISPNYKTISKNIDGIKVNSYYLDFPPPEEISSPRITNNTSLTYVKITPREEAERLLNFSIDTLSYLNNILGKYPYSEFNIVETYLEGGAMEYPTIIQMPKYGYLDVKENVFNNWLDINNQNIARWLDQSVVHETIHQWFYSLVGNNEFTEPFLDESITNYLTNLYFREKGLKFPPITPFRSLDDKDLCTSPPINSSVDKFNNWDTYTEVIYGNGSMVFEALEKEVGKETVISILRDFFTSFKYENATLEDFLNILEKKAGTDIKNKVHHILTYNNL